MDFLKLNLTDYRKFNFFAVLVAFALLVAAAPQDSQAQVNWQDTALVDDLYDFNPIIVRSATYTISAASHTTAIQVPVLKGKDDTPVFITGAELSVAGSSATSGSIAGSTIEILASANISSGSETPRFALERANNADTSVWMSFPDIDEFGTYQFPVSPGSWIKIYMHGTSSTVVHVSLRWIPGIKP